MDFKWKNRTAQTLSNAQIGGFDINSQIAIRSQDAALEDFSMAL